LRPSKKEGPQGKRVCAGESGISEHPQRGFWRASRDWKMQYAKIEREHLSLKV